MNMKISKIHKPQQSRVIVSAHSPLQQRSLVMQRMELKYDNYIKGNLGNEAGKVYFTKYNGQELFSSGFSGCIMAVFKFKDLESAELRDILNLNGNILDKESSYIAHVYAMSEEKSGDTKYQFAELEEKGLIHIEAMYKPCVYERDLFDIQSINGVTSNYNLNCLTGSMFKSDYNGGWIGNTYYQDINGQVKHIKNYFDNDMIQKETYYLKGFLGITLQENEYSDLKSAKTKLEDYLEGIKQYKNTHKDIQLPAYIIQDLN